MPWRPGWRMRSVGSPAWWSPSRSRPTQCSRSCRRTWHSGCSSAGSSTRGTRRPARCGGCAPGTRPRPTSMRSRPTSRPRPPSRREGGVGTVLPQGVRSLVPERIRDAPRLRALAVGAGVIPPRTMHSQAEADLLERVAGGRRKVVEIGVYEGSSAVVLCRVLRPDAELHLIDPFGHHPDALRPGWAATEAATRRVVARAARDHGPKVTWHVAF